MRTLVASALLYDSRGVVLPLMTHAESDRVVVE